MQTFKGDHSDEYLLSRPNRTVTLYKNGITLLQWDENEDSTVGNITFFEDGIIQLIQVREKGEKDIVRVINRENGPVMESEDPETHNIIFRGGYDESLHRDGLGTEYDRQTGHVTRQSIWKEGHIIQHLRFFEGDEMIEFDPAFDNIEVYDRVPIYKGGYMLDEKTGEYVRHGKGNVFENHVATRASEWKCGKEIKKTAISNGWYEHSTETTNDEMEIHDDPDFSLPSIDSGDSDESDSTDESDDDDNEEHQIALVEGPIAVITEDIQFTSLSKTIEQLQVSSNSCNSVNRFELKSFDNLQSIKIGDECFSRVDFFCVSSMPKLKQIEIKMNSFTKELSGWKDNSERSFHLLHCPVLESITIGRYSFSDYGGDFELEDLPSLIDFNVGVFDKESWNFSNSSLVLRNLPMLKTVIMGDKSFGYSNNTVFESFDR